MSNEVLDPSPHERRGVLRGALVAAAAAGAAFTPWTRAVAGPSLSISPSLPQCAEPAEVICRAAALEQVRQGPDGANQLFAIAQQVAASPATSQQLQTLIKLYGKVLEIRGGAPAQICHDTLSYHY